ncbi:hypothetical protein D3A96_15280 [Robertkochia marina]|nr:hypothetical protein D3A96_15280 [Robertkochia marina]
MNITEKLQLLDTLKESISSNLETEDVDLELINNEELVVVLKDSKFQDYSTDEKRNLSYEIGQMVSNLEIELENGQVQFLTEEKQGFFKTSDGESFDMFK